MNHIQCPYKVQGEGHMLACHSRHRSSAHMWHAQGGDYLAAGEPVAGAARCGRWPSGSDRAHHHAGAARQRRRGQARAARLQAPRQGVSVLLANALAHTLSLVVDVYPHNILQAVGLYVMLDKCCADLFGSASEDIFAGRCAHVSVASCPAVLLKQHCLLPRLMSAPTRSRTQVHAFQGAGRLSTPLHLEVSQASARARAAVEAAGGSVKTVYYNKLGAPHEITG